MPTKTGCRSCEMLSINGRACHETSCPDAWIGRRVSCPECGEDFKPEERGQKYCSTCCSALATGGWCDCEVCEGERAEQGAWEDGNTWTDHDD